MHRCRVQALPGPEFVLFVCLFAVVDDDVAVVVVVDVDVDVDVVVVRPVFTTPPSMV